MFGGETSNGSKLCTERGQICYATEELRNTDTN